MFALTGMNLPMYSALRRCIPFPSAVLSYIVFSKKPAILVQLSVAVITIGAVTAGLIMLCMNRAKIFQQFFVAGPV